MFYKIFIFALLADISTKYLAFLFLQDRINILGDYFYLDYIINPGIAFGIVVQPLVLKILTIALIIGIYLYYKAERLKQEQIKKHSSILLDLGFGLILAGAIGNGIERVSQGGVIDFIGIKYFSVFNTADSFITIGAMILIFYYYKASHKGTASDLEK